MAVLSAGERALRVIQMEDVQPIENGSEVVIVDMTAGTALVSRASMQ